MYIFLNCSIGREGHCSKVPTIKFCETAFLTNSTSKTGVSTRRGMLRSKSFLLTSCAAAGATHTIRASHSSARDFESSNALRPDSFEKPSLVSLDLEVNPTTLKFLFF